MPTLLSINNYYYYRGGAETVFLEQNRMFSEMGWQVAPFAMKHPKNLPSEWSDYFVDEIEFGEQYSLLQKIVRTPKVIYSFEAVRKLSRLIDAIKPDVCHAHNIYHHISPSILRLLKSRGIPTVLTLHDLKIACPAYNMLSHDGICERCRGGRVHNVLVNRCIKGSAALSAVVMMEAIVHRMLALLSQLRKPVCRSQQVLYRQTGRVGHAGRVVCPCAEFRRCQSLYTAVRTRKGFSVLRSPAREKGIATLINAAAQARVSLVVVGTGPQQAELQELAQRLKADVTFLGYQDRPRAACGGEQRAGCSYSIRMV